MGWEGGTSIQLPQPGSGRPPAPGRLQRFVDVLVPRCSFEQPQTRSYQRASRQTSRPYCRPKAPAPTTRAPLTARVASVARSDAAVAKASSTRSARPGTTWTSKSAPAASLAAMLTAGVAAGAGGAAGAARGVGNGRTSARAGGAGGTVYRR